MLLPLELAGGRVLSRDVAAVVGSPPFTCAAMDGFAVCGPGPWQIVGRALAGAPLWQDRLPSGGAVEIGTGSVMPPGAEAVIPYEQCRVVGAAVTADLGVRRHIRIAGEDFAARDVVALAGQQVTGAMSSVLAQSGVDEVWVTPRPSVWLIVTGDEVITTGVPVAGQVRDAHTPVVAALASRAGGVFAGRAVIGDDPQQLHVALQQASACAEVIAVSGSSSAGRADHLREVLAGMGGRWLVDGVACRPGHPQGLGQTAGGCWVVSLPGNPFAGLVAGLTLLDPLLSSLAGRSPGKELRLPVFGDAQSYPAGVRLVPVAFDGAGARVIAGARPGSLHAVARADAVAVIEPSWSDGEAAELLLVA